MHRAMNEVPRSEDRISVLPYTVLGHVLSYVSTKELVRTTVLSKRWALVWSYVPVLHLDDSCLSSTDPYQDQAIHSSFIKFVNNALNPCKAGSLQKLILKCSKFDRYHVNEWVMAAMKRRVPELDLCVTTNDDFRLCVPLFVYKDLVDLKLGEKFVVDIPGEVLLPCLKNLYLHSIKFSNDESCPKLLSGCPVLEHLNLNSCCMLNVDTLQIIAPALKSLRFQYYENVHDHDKFDYQVVVDAPNLEDMRFECFMPGGYSFKNLNSLSTVRIEVDLGHFDRSKVSEIRETALQLVNGIANAKLITITGYSLDFLSFLDPTALPIFNNCTKLVVGGNKYCGTLLPKFLENSPCLQNLVLDKAIAYEGMFGAFVCHNPAQVPKCLSCSLVKVEIRGYDVQRDMAKLVWYLVSNGKVLAELSSDSDKEEHKGLKVCKKLLSSLLKI